MESNLICNYEKIKKKSDWFKNHEYCSKLNLATQSRVTNLSRQSQLFNALAYRWTFFHGKINSAPHSLLK